MGLLRPMADVSCSEAEKEGLVEKMKKVLTVDVSVWIWSVCWMYLNLMVRIKWKNVESRMKFVGRMKKNE